VRYDFSKNRRKKRRRKRLRERMETREEKQKGGREDRMQRWGRI
jgi:hypothetical protein